MLIGWMMIPVWRYRLSRDFHWKDRAGGNHIALGSWGEGVAADYVRAHGGKLLYRNFRGPRGGEVDLVLRDGQQLCFVEVKTRRKRSTGRPMDAVTQDKQALLERGGRAWLKLLQNRDILWRYDVVEVELVEGQPPLVTWVKNAF